MRQCLGGFGLFLRDLRGSLTVRAGRALISVQSNIADPLTRVYAEETYLVLMIGMLCWLAGRRIAIDRTELAVSRPAQDDDLLLWGPDLRLGSGRTEVEFDSAYLRLPVVQDLATLKTFLRSAPQVGDPFSQPERTGGAGVPAFARPALWAVADLGGAGAAAGDQCQYVPPAAGAGRAVVPADQG